MDTPRASGLQWSIAAGVALVVAAIVAVLVVLLLQLRSDVDRLQRDGRASKAKHDDYVEATEARIADLEGRFSCVLNLFSDIYDEGDPPAPGEAAARLLDCPAINMRSGDAARDRGLIVPRS